MKIFNFILPIVIFLAFSQTAFATTCGPTANGTCRFSCIAGQESWNNLYDFPCQPTSQLCCLPVAAPAAGTVAPATSPSNTCQQPGTCARPGTVDCSSGQVCTLNEGGVFKAMISNPAGFCVGFCRVLPAATQSVPNASPTQSVPNTIPVQSVPNTVGNSGTGVTLMNPLGSGTTLNSFLLSILSIVTDVIGPIIVILMLVYVGFKFVTAQGEPGKITEARQMLMWTVVGALILLGAKAIAIGIKATVEALSTGS
jgi:hypothetical protein